MDDFTKVSQLYDHSLEALHTSLYTAKSNNYDAECIAIASDLIEQAKTHDIQSAFAMTATNFYGAIKRNVENPVFYECTSIQAQPWADSSKDPLEKMEQWNQGRRVTSSGVAYILDEDNHPVNPYMNMGIKGRGIIGRYGPNHAVDIGALRIIKNSKGQPALHALGIIRQDNNLPALCGGFSEFIKYGEGFYVYNQEVISQTQSQEFFEEMVSGSVKLLPEYSEGLEAKIERHILFRENEENKILNDKERAVIRDQLTTHRKLEQVRRTDPLFFAELRSTFREAQYCYSGPVLSSSRNTNTAWMETKLSWFMLDEQKWNTIKGKSDYKLAAGDDAQAVLWHEITPELIEKSQSHGALFSYLLSSYLLTQAAQENENLPYIKEQAKELAAFLSSKNKQFAPTPV